MLSDKKIILYGAGDYGKLGLSYFGARNVYCFADSNRHGGFYLDKRIISFDELLMIHHDFDVVICVRYGTSSDNILTQCKRAGICAVHINAVISIDDFESDTELSVFKDKYAGKRCFVIGNGPSLRAGDLERIRLAGDISFGCNNIFHIFPNTTWRPSLYFMTDKVYITQEIHTIASFVSSKIFVSSTDYNMANDKNTQYAGLCGADRFLVFNRVGLTDARSAPRFSCDPSRGVYLGETVTYVMLQWAAYMGFKEVYLLGVDFTSFPDADPLSLTAQTHFYDQELDQKYINTVNISSADTHRSIWRNAFLSAEDYSREHGFRIYNATRGGLLDVFERVSFDALFESASI